MIGAGSCPNKLDLIKYKGLIIPGSILHAVNDKDGSLQEIYELIDYGYKNCKQLNMLGICFGAQGIAVALGGHLEKMSSGFIRRGEELEIEPEFFELEYVKKLNIDPKKKLTIAQAHENEITLLPEGAKRIASSTSCKMEGYIIGDRVLGFQGHPEYNEYFQAGAQFRSKKPDLVEGYTKYEDEFISENYKNKVSQKELLEICYSFLKK